MEKKYPTKSTNTAVKPVFIRHLAKLPRELVHQVLNDLPIIKILQILASKEKTLVDSVFTHIHYQVLFINGDVGDIVERYNLYREITLFKREGFRSGG